MQVRNYILKFTLGAFCLAALQACNKEFEPTDALIPTVTQPGPTGTISLGAIVNTDTSFSFLKAAVTKAGLTSLLADSTKRFTLFAPDNAAFRRSGIPSEAVITSVLDAATLRAIVSYHLAGGYLPADSIPTTFPNLQYPTYLNPAPQLSPLLRLTIFPSRNAHGGYVNNIPITAVNTQASNGVLHRVAALVSPPSKSLYELITADTTLSFLAAALVRADSGFTTLASGSLIEAAKSIGANLTLFAPTNSAFRALLPALGLPPSAAAFNFAPVTTVRGLLAYHLLSVRAFSVNMPTTPTFVKTVLNASLPAAHPGINIMASFTGPFVTTFMVTGVGNGGSSSRVIAQDLHATNGVMHKIDRVLLPQ